MGIHAYGTTSDRRAPVFRPSLSICFIVSRKGSVPSGAGNASDSFDMIPAPSRRLPLCRDAWHARVRWQAS